MSQFSRMSKMRIVISNIEHTESIGAGKDILHYMYLYGRPGEKCTASISLPERSTDPVTIILMIRTPMDGKRPSKYAESDLRLCSDEE